MHDGTVGSRSVL